jgi:hypothetical protein
MELYPDPNWVQGEDHNTMFFGFMVLLELAHLVVAVYGQFLLE